jgi:hypothetical protein
MSTDLKWETFISCDDPKCERNNGHDDEFGHWYTVWVDECPSYPVQWGHNTLVPGGVDAREVSA